jgi:single-strand DNA-binding protein
MIEALIGGRLVRDPVTHIGPSGKPYCNFLLACDVGDSAPVIVSGIAFGEAADKIGAMAKGDALSVAGSLKPSSWTDKATGETRNGLNITVQAVLTLQNARKPTNGTRVARKPKSAPSVPDNRSPWSLPFDDDIAF